VFDGDGDGDSDGDGDVLGSSDGDGGGDGGLLTDSAGDVSVPPLSFPFRFRSSKVTVQYDDDRHDGN
jgi:hypothetical protein